MTFGHLAEVLTEHARSYRNGQLSHDIVPQLHGHPLSEEVVREVLLPYILKVEPDLPLICRRLIWRRYDEYKPQALARIRLNVHMHEATNFDILTQASADALLVLFINDAVVPLDLGLYTRSLLPQEG